ncbi:MAG: hypothetical protein RL217_1496, partial [Pseudomonadota bacterium]
MFFKKLTPILLSCAALNAQALSFDRPGFGFATEALEPGQAVLELSTPNYENSKNSGTRFTALGVDGLLRFGLMPNFELQLGSQFYGWQQSKATGQKSQTQQGLGDGSLAIKWASDLGLEHFSLGFLLGTSLPFGDAPIGDQGEQSDLDMTLNWALPHELGLGLYANHQNTKDEDGWMIAPSFSFPLFSDFAGYLEIGYGEGSQQGQSAGGGITYAVTP